MNQPGLSIFQGAGSLHVNTSAQRKEEEEELLDQERRHKEVQQRLDNEFGDLSDDNDETTNTNAGSFVDNLYQTPIAAASGCAGPRHNGVVMHDPNERDLLMARFNEQKELEDLRSRLAICESEKQRAFMARKQSHELLVESKAKISEQENMVEKLKLKIKELEKQNTKIETDLQYEQTKLSDALLKVQMIEQSAGLVADRDREFAVKKLNDRCKAQVEMMQQQIDSLRNQLDDRDREVKTITARYNELQRSREALLIEKSDTINQLSRSVEESQRQCQQLMAQNDNNHENVRLQSTISQLNRQVDTMANTINRLEQSLETANTELDSMANLINETAHNSIRTPQNGPITNSTPMYDKTSLRNELSRCLNDQRERRAEVKQLQDELSNRESEIQAIREEKNYLLINLEKQKDEHTRSLKRIKHLQTDLSRLFAIYNRTISTDQNYSEQIIDEIETEHTQFHGKYLQMQQSVENMSKQLANMRDERNSMEKRLLEFTATKELESDQESQKQPQLISSHLRQLEDECENLRQKYIELAAEKERVIKELMELKQLDVSAKYMVQVERIAGLELMLEATEQRCKELQARYDLERDEFKQKLKDIDAQLREEQLSKTQDRNELHKLQTLCDESHKQIADLMKQLQVSTDTVADLRQNVAMKFENDKLLNDLQEKARHFDQFIQSQQVQSRSPSSSHNQPQRCSSEPMASGSPLASSRKDEERMAKVLATKLKKIEDAAAAQEQQFRHIIQELEQSLSHFQETLDIRDGEVQMLKHAILSERAKTKEMMEDRDAEVGELFEKQQCLLNKYRERLDEAQRGADRVAERLAKANEERSKLTVSLDRLRAEKEKWRVDREQWLLNQEQICLNENHLRTMISEMETAQQAIVADWEAKYKKAKKTAASYKKYAEEKDIHIEKENERVRQSYEQAVQQMQQKMEQLIKDGS